jgi:hypothetical protein
MKTPTAIRNTPSTIQERIKRYGITERKKTELDALTIQVMDAQENVAQYQSIVTSLTGKSADFQTFLATAAKNKTQAYTNKVLVDQLVQSAADLQSNSDIAFNEMVLANARTKTLTANVNAVMSKLIYSAEVINKLATLVIRKKALNPLISDELVSMIITAGTDANNAVALTLIALQSTFTSQATEMESETAVGLEYTQSIALTKLLSGGMAGGSTTSLQGLLHKASADAKKNYILIEKASFTTTKQLNKAIANLNTAQVKLKSLQSGLAAANAAALAS